MQARAHHDLDEAEWLIGVLRARLDGFVEPPLPARRAGDLLLRRLATASRTVDVDLGGIALQRIPVRTCAPCAVSLVRGERPRSAPSQIGGHTVPWPAAPAAAAPTAGRSRISSISTTTASRSSPSPRARDARRRQTVAERARGVRARVCRAPDGAARGRAGRVLGDDLDGTPRRPPDDEPPSSAERSPTLEQRFAAMEGETPAASEPAPAATTPRPSSPRGAGRAAAASMRAVANALLWPVRRIGALLPDGWGGLARQLAIFIPFDIAYELSRAFAQGRRADGAPARARRRARREGARHLPRARGAATGRSMRPTSSMEVAKFTYFQCQFTITFGFVIWV